MCLIIASTGPKPTEATLRDAARRNSDGNGFAWLHKGQVQWRKGITTDEIVKMVAQAKGPFVAHFRIGTHGPKVPELTHPFPITAMSLPSLSGRATRVLFQNGTYSSWESELKQTLITTGTKCPPPPWSDARALAVMTYHYGPDFLRLCGTSRFLVFDASRPKPILMIGDWHKGDDGCMYSNNLSCMFTTGSTGGGPYGNFPQTSRHGVGSNAGTWTSQTRTAGEHGSNTNTTSTKHGTPDASAQADALCALDPRLVWTGYTPEGFPEARQMVTAPNGD